MSIIKKIIGPKSKYDKALPYTYEARIDVLGGAGNEPLYSSYFSDTVCGLIEYLDENNIEADEVQLYGVYMGKEMQLDTKHCTSPSGRWLKPPALCKVLEEHYKNTMEEQYKGHMADDKCSFDDRDQKAI